MIQKEENKGMGECTPGRNKNKVGTVILTSDKFEFQPKILNMAKMSVFNVKGHKSNNARTAINCYVL